MGNRWVVVLDRWLHKWLDYGVLETILLYRLRLGPLHLGCNREVPGGASPQQTGFTVHKA